MKGAHNNVILIIWVAVNLFSLVLSQNICGKANEQMLISYNISTSVNTIQWNVNGASFYTASLKTDGSTCKTPPFPPVDYDVQCSNVKVSGFNYFGLEILKPKDGDSYYTTDPNDIRTIIVQEPAIVTVDITSPVTTDTVLPRTDTIIMECQSSTCTKPRPNIKWEYITNGTRTPISNTSIPTFDATGCAVNLRKINSQVEISKDNVPLNVTFQVVCVLSYDVCNDYKYEKITDYTITITGTGNTDPGVDSSGLTAGPIAGIIFGVIVLIVLIVIAVWWIRKKKGPPFDIKFSPAETDRICLTWSASGNCCNTQTFIVQHSTDGKSWTDSTTTSTGYCIENLTPDTAYRIRVGNGDNPPEKGEVFHIRTKKTVENTTNM